jgi:hypothetical protein
MSMIYSDSISQTLLMKSLIHIVSSIPYNCRVLKETIRDKKCRKVI